MASDVEILDGPRQIPGSINDYYLIGPCNVPDAEKTAASLGGRLWAIGSFDERNYLLDLFGNFDGTPRSVWTGLSDEVEEGDWRWSTGEIPSYTPWFPNRPTVDTARNNAYMTPGGLLFDADGSRATDDETPLYAIVEIGDVDCNGNGVPDSLDIDDQESEDLDGDGVPDECQSEDCTGNGVPDQVEILTTPWLDCDGDGVLDACAALENPEIDCNGNLIADVCEGPDSRGFLGTYYTNQSLSTEIVSRIQDEINFTIGGNAPWPNAGFTDFAARWVGVLEAPFTGFYTFHVTSDDGVRLYVDGEAIIDDWRPHSSEEVSAGVFLSGGDHAFVLEWFDSGGDAQCILEWTPAFGARQYLTGDSIRPFVDCDGNGVNDSCDAATDPALDCNQNGLLDECEAAAVDCDGDGLYDWCELTDNDCDLDGVPDDCEIADAVALDCQLDGVPDNCQIGQSLSLGFDDGGPEYGVRAAGTSMAWLRQVHLDGRQVQAVAIEVDFVNTTAGRQVRACLWRDPDSDGDPSNAVLVDSVLGQITNPAPSVRDRFELSGQILDGTDHYIGIIMNGTTDDDFPAGLDATTPYQYDSWLIGDDEPIDPTDISAEDRLEFNRLDGIGAGVWFSNWILRLEVLTSDNDCNFDGVPDDCQIADGLFEDLDGNLVPDACEDCDGNGVIDRCEIACDSTCKAIYGDDCGGEADCNGDGIPDACQTAAGTIGDCDGNGIPDSCELDGQDCDGNGRIDDCEIASGSTEDCNGDGVIDLCQFGGPLTYRFDRGIGGDALGFGDGLGFWWATQFDVYPGATTIDYLDVVIGQVGLGNVAFLAIWADPTQDGDPSDMYPVVEESVFVENENIPGEGTTNVTRIEFDPIDIGPPGTVFFAGCVVTPVPGALPATFDNTVFADRSWFGRGVTPSLLSSFRSLGASGFEGEWLIRAGRLGEEPLYDCNDNQRLDSCDIADGAVPDLDLDGRPDDCEPVCLADFDGNDIVDGSDLGQFLLEWNAGNSRADLDGNGIVNGADFGAMLIAWGACP